MTKSNRFWDHQARAKPRQNQEQGQPKRRNKSLDEWQDLVMERINQAMERGDFANLPGKGKPLNLAENPNEPVDVRMAHKMLKNNDLAPAWMMDRRRLVGECQALGKQIEQKWLEYGRAYVAEENEDRRVVIALEWTALIQVWQDQIQDLNRRIRDLNLTLPIWRMELLRVDLDRELDRVGGRRHLDA